MSLAPERLETVLVKPHFISYLIMILSFEEIVFMWLLPRRYVKPNDFVYAGNLVLHDQFRRISSFL